MEGPFLWHKPILQILIPKLTPLDFIVLCRAFPRFHTICTRALGITIHSHFKKCLMQALRMINNHESFPDRFMTLLEQGRYWLTGGFLLDVLHWDYERFTCSNCDIDIATDHPMSHDYLLLDAMKRQLPPSEVPPDVIADDVRMDLSDYGHSRFIIDVFNYRVLVADAMKTVQFIQVEKDRAKDYISGFDFSFCRNAFDGHRLYLASGNVRSIVTREFYVPVAEQYFSQLKNQSPARVFTCFKRIQERLNKYRARGYDITTCHLGLSDSLNCIAGPNRKSGSSFYIDPLEHFDICQRDYENAQLWTRMWYDTKK